MANNCIFCRRISKWAVSSDILQTVVLCTTLKPNGQFSVNFFWWEQTQIEHFEWMWDLCCLAICNFIYYTLRTQLFTVFR